VSERVGDYSLPLNHTPTHELALPELCRILGPPDSSRHIVAPQDYTGPLPQLSQTSTTHTISAYLAQSLPYHAMGKLACTFSLVPQRAYDISELSTPPVARKVVFAANPHSPEQEAYSDAFTYLPRPLRDIIRYSTYVAKFSSDNPGCRGAVAAAKRQWKLTYLNGERDPANSPPDLQCLTKTSRSGTNLSDPVACPTKECITNDGGREARSESATRGFSDIVGD
jgi:hypothetical protein